MKIIEGTRRVARSALVLFAVGVGGLPASVVAAELVVYSTKDCAITQRFRRDVSEQYTRTLAGQTFPLHLVNIEGNAGVVLSAPVTTSPTFVFVDEGREIARFVGYPGRQHFLKLTNAAAEAFAEQKGGR